MNSRLIRLIPLLTAITVVTVGAVAAFYGIMVNSFWMDELFTAHFADPALQTPSDLFRRAAQDVNPPGYYFLIWSSFQLIDVEFVLGTRTLSAIFGVVALLCVILVPPRHISWTARFGGAAFATGSIPWILSAQNARSYALLFVLILCILGIFWRLVQEVRSNKIAPIKVVAMLVVSMTAVFVHYYTITLIGALFTLLLIFCRTPKTFLTISLAGLSILVGTIFLVLWHQPQMVVPLDQTWFRADAIFLVSSTIIGVKQMFGSQPQMFAAALFFILFVRFRKALPIEAKSPTEQQNGRFLLLFLSAMIIATAYGMLITFLHKPMLGPRFFWVLTPTLWLIVVLLLDDILRGLPAVEDQKRKVIYVSVLSVCFAMQISVSLRGLDINEPWRQTAEVVASEEGCSETVLPVVWFDEEYSTDGSADILYGFYMSTNASIEWQAIPKGKLISHLQSEEFGEIVKATAEQRRACPVLLWDVELGQQTSDDDVLAAVRTHLPMEDWSKLSVYNETKGKPNSGRLVLLRP